MRIIKELFVSILALGFVGVTGLACAGQGVVSSIVENGALVTTYSPGADPIAINTTLCHFDGDAMVKSLKTTIVCTADGKSSGRIIGKYICQGSWENLGGGGYSCGEMQVLRRK